MTEAAAPMLEVHRWRGSPEQRALRDDVRKLGQFSYFDRQLGHPDWSGRSVLDFGGSDGNLLRNPDCTIAPENYTCLDVVGNAIDEGRKAFPRGHWVHYDRYNCSFNPDGVRDLPIPELGASFDFILAYSVFTHTTRQEMHDLAGQLRARLAPGGVLAFTFEDPHYRPAPEVFEGNNLQWRLQALRGERCDAELDRLAAEGRGADWCALVDGAALSVNASGESSACMNYDIFYAAEFMQLEFPDGVVCPPVNGEMQHCCIVRRSR